MRDALATAEIDPRSAQSHPGLWWTRMAPIPSKGGESISPSAKEALVNDVCNVPVPAVYERAFRTWEAVGSRPSRS